MARRLARGHRGVRRPAAGRAGHPGGHPRRGRHAAGPRRLPVRADRLRRAPQGRGRQPDRLVQGPWHDGRDLQGARGGRDRRHLRVDRQHQRLGRRVRRQGRAVLRRARPARQDRRRASSPRPLVHDARLLQVEGNFDDCLRLARDLADELPVALVNSVNAVPHRGPEDGRVRDRRHPRPGARRALPAGRQRGQHHGVLEGLPGVRRRRTLRPAPDVGLPGRGRRADRAAATGSTPRTPSRPRSGSATRRRGPARSRPATSPAA